VSAFTLGAARKIVNYKNFFVSLGALSTVYRVEKELRPSYGNLPFSVEVFLRISPSSLKMGYGTHDMEQMGR
jgi:hypothetical protein